MGLTTRAISQEAKAEESDGAGAERERWGASVILGRRTESSAARGKGIWWWLKGERLPLLRRRERGHILTFAPSYSGIVTGLVAPNLLSFTGDAIVFGGATSLFPSSGPWRSENVEGGLGQDVRIFDPHKIISPAVSGTDSLWVNARHREERTPAQKRRDARFYKESVGYINPLATIWKHGPGAAEKSAGRIARRFAQTLKEKGALRFSEKEAEEAVPLMTFLFLRAYVSEEEGAGKGSDDTQTKAPSIPKVAQLLEMAAESSQKRENLRGLIRTSAASPSATALAAPEYVRAVLRKRASALLRRGEEKFAAQVAAGARAMRFARSDEGKKALGGTSQGEQEGQLIDPDDYFKLGASKGKASRDGGKTLYVVAPRLRFGPRGLFRDIIEGSLLASALRSAAPLHKEAPAPEDQTLLVSFRPTPFQKEYGLSRLMRPENERSGARVWAHYQSMNLLFRLFGKRKGCEVIESAKIVQSAGSSDLTASRKIAKRARKSGMPAFSSGEAVRRMRNGQLLSFGGEQAGRVLETIPYFKEEPFASRAKSLDLKEQ